MIGCGSCGCAVQVSEAKAALIRSFGSDVVCEGCFADFAPTDGTDCLMVPFPAGKSVPFNVPMWYANWTAGYCGPRLLAGFCLFEPVEGVLLLDRWRDPEPEDALPF